MRKSGFTIIEVVVVFLLILGVTFLTLPKGLDSTRQAKFISQWVQKYSDLEYMFSVFNAQLDGEAKKEFEKKRDLETAEFDIPDLFKSYLRINSEYVSPKYSVRYMSGENVKPNDKYFFKKQYLTDDGEIVAIKWLKSSCDDADICAMMSFDINGSDLPNKWGYDIFGINVSKDTIEPLGKGLGTDILRANCSNHAYGVYCSYYYFIGGKFD